MDHRLSPDLGAFIHSSVRVVTIGLMGPKRMGSHAVVPISEMSMAMRTLDWLGFTCNFRKSDDISGYVYN